MKMKTILLTVILLLEAGIGLKAQKLIALQHNGASTFFDDINATLTAAVNNDTIYLPGRSFTGFTLDKKLTIVGVGHNPDSTAATSLTTINGGITITSNANYSYITGLHIVYGIYFSDNASFITINRCYIGTYISIGVNNIGLLISENYINGNCYSIGLNSGLTLSNAIISNNIIRQPIVNIQNSSIRNNIFFVYWYYCGSNIYDCLLENNILYGGTTNGSNNAYYNNIGGGVNGNSVNGDHGSGNIIDANFYTIFSTWSAPWDYTDDFHLSNPAYNTGGTDGTPIGVYGGLFPWKAGSVPFNPHIQTQQINEATDSNGNLNVNIRVKAQDH